LEQQLLEQGLLQQELLEQGLLQQELLEQGLLQQGLLEQEYELQKKNHLDHTLELLVLKQELELQ
jgi:hypothetical protein